MCKLGGERSTVESALSFPVDPVSGKPSASPGVRPLLHASARRRSHHSGAATPVLAQDASDGRRDVLLGPLSKHRRRREEFMLRLA